MVNFYFLKNRRQSSRQIFISIATLFFGLSVFNNKRIFFHFRLLEKDVPSDSASRAVREAEILQKHLSANGFDLVSPLVESQIHLAYPSSRHQNQVWWPFRTVCRALFPTRLILTSIFQAVILGNEGKIILQINDTRQRYAEETADNSPAMAPIEVSF